MNNAIIQLHLFKLHPDAQIPRYGTSMAACFDLHFAPCGRFSIQGYNNQNDPIDAMVYADVCDIHPGDRLLVPTGLVAKIVGTPDNIANYSIRIHARSGMSLKQGLVLANAEGVVDVDYQKEIFVMLTNISNETAQIRTGDRIAQAEIVKNVIASFFEVADYPAAYSERDGGFGSTGHS